MKIRHAKNVGKVWIGRNKKTVDPFGDYIFYFSMVWRNPKHVMCSSIFLGALAAILPWWPNRWEFLIFRFCFVWYSFIGLLGIKRDLDIIPRLMVLSSHNTDAYRSV